MMTDSMFEGFLKTARSRSECEKAAAEADDGTFRHLQVRLTARDAKRVRCLADLRNLSIQDALVEAINSLLADWQEQPVSNPGTRKRGG